MKAKKIASLLLAVMLAVGTLPAAMAAQERPISVTIDGAAVDFSEYDDILPFIGNGTTLVLIRAVAEGLGFAVSWDAAAKTVGIEGRGTIILTIHADTAVVNGQTVALDVPARIVSGRTFVPLQFVSEDLGARVEWDETSGTITIENGRDGGRHGMGGPERHGQQLWRRLGGRPSAYCGDRPGYHCGGRSGRSEIHTGCF